MIIMAVPTVLLILFFRSKPKYPPSFAAVLLIEKQGEIYILFDFR